MIRIAHLQPLVPHYREAFFARLGEKAGQQDIYTFERPKDSKAQEFLIGKTCQTYLPSRRRGALLLYDPRPFLRGHYDALVLMLHFGHLTTWLLLLTKWLHRRKIVLWGQGISVKRYLQEERKPDWKLRLMIALADGVWLYMEKECEQWQRVFPNKPMVALCNSLTGVEQMTTYRSDLSVAELKRKYNITQRRVLIFCARFESTYRRVDLLVETIKRLDPENFAFVIIGAGRNKPDFSPFPNVYDFGAVYDTDVKRELFTLADIYYQPGWVGLSIVEAMAYGKPIFTFVRSNETFQCVEYSYIRHGWNGMLLNDISQAVNVIRSCSAEELETMGNNARDYVQHNLSVDQMASRGMKVVEAVVNKHKHCQGGDAVPR